MLSFGVFSRLDEVKKASQRDGSEFSALAAIPELVLLLLSLHSLPGFQSWSQPEQAGKLWNSGDSQVNFPTTCWEALLLFVFQTPRNSFPPTLSSHLTPICPPPTSPPTRTTIRKQPPNQPSPCPVAHLLFRSLYLCLPQPRPPLPRAHLPPAAPLPISRLLG